MYTQPYIEQLCFVALVTRNQKSNTVIQKMRNLLYIMRTYIRQELKKTSLKCKVQTA